MIKTSLRRRSYVFTFFFNLGAFSVALVSAIKNPDWFWVTMTAIGGLLVGASFMILAMEVDDKYDY